MRHRPGSLALALAGGLLLGATPPSAAPAEVTIVAKNLRHSHGVVRACLTGLSDRFPRCDDPRTFTRVSEAAGTVTLVFRDVPAGRYAVALLHDENANGKADRAAMMIPKEGFGFSRDAKVRFGPPRFGDAAFDLVSGAREQMVIKMRYML